MSTRDSKNSDSLPPKNVRFSDRSFWSKVKRSARNAGEKTLTVGFTLYNTFRDEKTPKWAKTVIGGALAYFVLPMDAIPDILPAIGFTDDLGAISAAAATVVVHVTKEHKKKAVEQVEGLFSKPKRKK